MIGVDNDFMRGTRQEWSPVPERPDDGVEFQGVDIVIPFGFVEGT